MIKKRKILGRTEDNTGVPVKGAKVIQTSSRILAEMDDESIKKSAEQQRNEVGVMRYAKEMIAGGPYDEEKGPTLTKKRR